MPSPKQVLLLKIGPWKVVLFLNKWAQKINSKNNTVFQVLHTLNVEKFKFRVKIWNWLGKSFPKMVLLLKIGPGKVVLFLNNRTQIINPLKKTVFQDLHTLKLKTSNFELRSEIGLENPFRKWSYFWKSDLGRWCASSITAHRKSLESPLFQICSKFS